MLFCFDLFATILDVASIAIPKENGRIHVDGISLLDHLKSGAIVSIPDRYLFWDLFANRAPMAHEDVDTGNHNGDFLKAARNADSADFTLVNLENDLGENGSSIRTSGNILRPKESFCRLASASCRLQLVRPEQESERMLVCFSQNKLVARWDLNPRPRT